MEIILRVEVAAVGRCNDQDLEILTKRLASALDAREFAVFGGATYDAINASGDVVASGQIKSVWLGGSDYQIQHDKAGQS